MTNVERLLWDTWDDLAMPLLFLLIFIGLSVTTCVVLILLEKRKRAGKQKD